MEPADTSDENGQGALGRALRGLRQRAGITQEEIGARVGIDPTYISRVEGGRINLRWARSNASYAHSTQPSPTSRRRSRSNSSAGQKADVC